MTVGELVQLMDEFEDGVQAVAESPNRRFEIVAISIGTNGECIIEIV